LITIPIIKQNYIPYDLPIGIWIFGWVDQDGERLIITKVIRRLVNNRGNFSKKLLLFDKNKFKRILREIFELSGNFLAVVEACVARVPQSNYFVFTEIGFGIKDRRVNSHFAAVNY
jgi:hypothetical protein